MAAKCREGLGASRRPCSLRRMAGTAPHRMARRWSCAAWRRPRTCQPIAAANRLAERWSGEKIGGWRNWLMVLLLLRARVITVGPEGASRSYHRVSSTNPRPMSIVTK